MSTNPTVVKALARLDGSQDFETVLEHLQREYENAVEAGSQASELIFIGRAQGKQQVLSEFLRLARTARRIVVEQGEKPGSTWNG